MKSSFRDFLNSQQEGLSAYSTVGIIGLHMVSGPLVGFAFGYGLDWLLGTHPYGKLAFFLIGIGAGFLNVYRDAQIVVKKLEKREQKKVESAREKSPKA
ncbi:MAG: AtpZ/AtpI family protein [Desulfovibrio sp.]|nr:AtpZ/AtpI family protein [Desulfovibrio sp.]